MARRSKNALFQHHFLRVFTYGKTCAGGSVVKVFQTSLSAAGSPAAFTLYFVGFAVLDDGNVFVSVFVEIVFEKRLRFLFAVH